jgi:hypothetical protein
VEGYATRSVDRLVAQAACYGESTGIYARRLLDGDQPWMMMRSAYRLIGLAKRYGAEAAEAACARAPDVDVITPPAQRGDGKLPHSPRFFFILCLFFSERKRKRKASAMTDQISHQLPGQALPPGPLTGQPPSPTAGLRRCKQPGCGTELPAAAGAILDILWPIHNGILRYTGFDVLEPFITYMPGKISHDQRRAELGRYADEIRALASRRRLFFHPRDHYGPGERLLPNVRPQSGFQRRSCG